MKPFNLEEAKAGKPLITRDGRDAKFIAHVPEAANFCKLIVLIDKEIFVFHQNGFYSSCEGSNADLFMKTMKKTVYVNLYVNGEWVSHTSASNARASATVKAFAIAVPIEIEE